MAMVITATPPAFASVHNPCLVTVFDNTKPQDSTTYPNYKYVCDIYIDGNLVTRLKSYPDPTNYAGVFDVGPIIRSYIETAFAPFTSFTGNQYRPWVEATLEIGEEYGGTTYTNLITDSPRKYFDTYKAGPFTSNAVMDGKLNKPATDRPTITVDEDTEYVLFPYFAGSSGSVSYDLGLTTNGVGTDVSSSISVTYPSGLCHINLSKAAIATVASGITFDKAALTIGGTTITVKYGCSAKYTPYTVAFLNQYGGYETYDFRLVSRKAIEMERRTYQQQPWRLGVSGAISYNTGQRYYNGRTTYGTYVKQQMTLNTDWLSDGEYTWLKQLASSPETWVLMDGYFVPCTLKIDRYDIRQGVSDKLTQLTVQIDYDGDYNTQFR